MNYMTQNYQFNTMIERDTNVRGLSFESVQSQKKQKKAKVEAERTEVVWTFSQLAAAF